MELATAVLLFLLGLILIVRGGDWFLDGAVWIAETTGVPRFIIGATIVSLATTLPELTVSVTGVLAGELDLAIGNAVGSVTANLGLIMGISAVCIPAAVDHKHFDFKAILMVAGGLLLWFLCRTGELSAWEGAVLFAVFGAYFYNNLRDAQASREADRRNRPQRRTVSYRQAVQKLAFFVLGLGGIVLGSRLLITYGSSLALLLGVPESVVGVTMVAIGTSLPELVTTITAIVKREPALSVGNILGANVIDLTMILPICAMISGGKLALGWQTLGLDIPVCLLACILAVAPPLVKGSFYRWQGVALLGLYGVYLALLVG